MPQIWAYCRVSTTKQEQELSLEEQERWAREFASNVGMELEVFRERASAKTILGRPIFQKMMADLQEATAAKRPRKLIMTSLNRLSRDMTDTLLVARTLRDMKVEMYVREIGVVQAETFAQRAALVGQSMGGEAENEARSSRARASWDRRRREGKPTSNKVPYGLELVGERDVPAPLSSVWVKNAFEWYAAGIGTPTIAARFKEHAPLHVARVARLDAEGNQIERVRKPVWEYNRIIKLLHQRRYRGTIVDSDLFDHVQQLMASKPRWRQTRNSEYPLSGAVKCDGCGRSFHGHTTKEKHKKKLADGTIAYYEAKRYRYYTCVVCGIRLKADWLEELFRQQVTRLVADEKLLKRWVAGERYEGKVEEARQEIAALERATDPGAINATRSRLWELASGGSYAASDLNAQLERLAKKVESDMARLRELRDIVTRRATSRRNIAQARALLSNFWSRYDAAGYEDKRALMAAVTGALGGVTANSGGLTWKRQNAI